jgi:GNAT superfamily N-acetyltransferase
MRGVLGHHRAGQRAQEGHGIDGAVLVRIHPLSLAQEFDLDIALLHAIELEQTQEQIGFARLITDYTRFGWLCDVIIDENWRGHGLGSWLATCVREHPELQTVHRWMLSTQDAHQVYQRLGWRVVQHSETLMEFPPS